MIEHRMAMFLPLWLLLALCPFGYGQQPSVAELPAKEQAKGEEGWGEAVNGLRLRLSADKTTVPVHGTFRLVLELEYVGQETGLIERPMLPPEIVIPARKNLQEGHGFNTLVTAEYMGKSYVDYARGGRMKVKLGNVFWKMKSGQRLRFELDTMPQRPDGMGVIDRRDIPDRETSYTFRSPTSIGFIAHEPGTYRLEATYSIEEDSQESQDRKGWTGRIKSKPLLLKLTKEKENESGGHTPEPN